MDDFEYHMTECKCLKAVLSIYILFTENDVFTKFRGRSFLNPRKSQSSHSQMFFKIGVLKNLANFTGKHLY